MEESVFVLTDLAQRLHLLVVIGLLQKFPFEPPTMGWDWKFRIDALCYLDRRGRPDAERWNLR